MKRAVPCLILVVLAALAITCTRVVVLSPNEDGGFLSSDGGLTAPPLDASGRDGP